MIKLKKYLKNLINLALLISVFIPFLSCTLQKPPDQKTQFKEKIIKAIESDLEVKAALFSEKNILYIYLPVSEKILQADRVKKAPKEIPFDQAFTFFKSKYENNAFTIEYTNKKLPKPKAFYEDINFNFTPYMQSVQSNALNILFETTDYLPANINFYQICVADILRGIIFKQTLYRDDLERFRAGALPWEEFNKRLLSKIKGNKKIIGDEYGQNINKEDLQLADFINDLLAYNFLTAKKPKEKDATEYIKETFYQITNNYNFDDYKYLNLKDVIDGRQETFLSFEIEKGSKGKAKPK